MVTGKCSAPNANEITDFFSWDFLGYFLQTTLARAENNAATNANHRVKKAI